MEMNKVFLMAAVFIIAGLILGTNLVSAGIWWMLIDPDPPDYVFDLPQFFDMFNSFAGPALWDIHEGVIEIHNKIITMEAEIYTLNNMISAGGIGGSGPTMSEMWAVQTLREDVTHQIATEMQISDEAARTYLKGSSITIKPMTFQTEQGEVWTAYCAYGTVFDPNSGLPVLEIYPSCTGVMSEEEGSWIEVPDEKEEENGIVPVTNWYLVGYDSAGNAIYTNGIDTVTDLLGEFGGRWMVTDAEMGACTGCFIHNE